MSELFQILPGEKDLFFRLSKGDEKAFEDIFHHYNQFLFPFILSKTKSNEFAEEIVQDIFIKLWDKRETLTEVENYRSYIYTMAVNFVYDHFRKAALNKKIQKHIFQTVAGHSNTTEEVIELKGTQALIDKAVEQLPAAQKKIYLLSRQKGMTHEEIAGELNISKRTVSNQVSSALQFIKDYLEKNGGAPVAIIMIMLKHFRS